MQAHIQAGAGAEQFGLGQPVAPGNVLRVQARQIQRHAPAGAAAGLAARFCACRLRTRTAAPAARVGQAVAHADLAAKDGAGDDGALPGEAKSTVHCHARNSPVLLRAAWCCAWASKCWRRAQVPGSSAWAAAVANSGASAMAVTLRMARTSSCTWATRSGGTQSALVMATLVLRMPSSCRICTCSSVCGITPSSAATTSRAWSMPTAPAAMVDEFFVAGHVNDAQHLPIGQRQVGVAQLDGDAALLLLFEAVGVGAGQRAHQGGFAVVDVLGGADDHGREIFNKK